jgi:hypothetical protein
VSSKRRENSAGSARAAERWRRCATLCLAALFSGACSEPTTGQEGPGGQGGQGGQGGAGASASATFIVVESISLVGEHGTQPREGATVALDLPGGTRMEQVTGTDGKVTFTGIDWSLGKAAATAHFGEHLTSLVDLDETRLAALRLIDGAVMLHLFAPVAPETVTVQGTLAGTLDDAHIAIVRATVAPGFVDPEPAIEWQGTPPVPFSISVPKGAPFTLQAIEKSPNVALPSGQGTDRFIHQIAERSFPATSTDLTGLVIDFAVDGLSMQTVDVSVATPARRESPVRTGLAEDCVSPLNRIYCTGFASHVDISPDGNQFLATLLWTEPLGSENPFYLLRVYTPRPFSRLVSSRSLSGWPVAGSLGTLPDTPLWLTPSVAVMHPLHEAIEWQLFDADVPSVLLLLSRGADVVWNVETGGDATSLVVPLPPSTVDTVAAFGSILTGVLIPYWPDPTTYRPEAFSISEVASFQP